MDDEDDEGDDDNDDDPDIQQMNTIVFAPLRFYRFGPGQGSDDEG